MTFRKVWKLVKLFTTPTPSDLNTVGMIVVAEHELEARTIAARRFELYGPFDRFPRPDDRWLTQHMVSCEEVTLDTSRCLAEVYEFGEK